ncbi:type VII secretion target [Nocardia zapadnayensis]|uniref:type VII secretion target n=1 Tax=Nocardia rhamnosiphila TaxID=426716 RepID=UPI002245CE34|nr:type VII secretion target [Nocardia zapadnayensis]MCX0270162.1 type VII secretion target [Nocardia zapadnayensis]
MPEELDVDPDKVDKFSASLRRLADENASATAYIDKWLAVDNTVWGDGGLIRLGLSAISEAHAQLKPNYETLGRLSAAAATELAAVAQMYRTTDRANAAALDRTYEAGK